MERIVKTNVEVLKAVLRDCVGRNNAISKGDVIKRVFKGYSSLSFLEKAYANTMLTRSMTYLRKYTDFFVVSDNSSGDTLLYIPKSKKELKPYMDRMTKLGKGVANGMTKAEKYIETKQFKKI